MKIIISESQHKRILMENINSELEKRFQNMKKFTKNVISEANKQINLDLSFLLAWGSTLGGLMGPVSDYIEGRYPELSNTDIALLCTGAILTYFTSNKEGLTKVLDKIKEKSLIQEFDHMLEKTGELKNVFISFIESFAIPVNKLSNMLAYSFLIPILPELYEMAQGFEEHDVMELFKRILYFVGVSVSGVFLKNLLLSIVNRFKT